MTKDLKFLNNIHIAHRGLHNISKGIPENSMLAFKKALENNIAIELDIHILKDNKIVVFHDNTLTRMTGVNKWLKDCTYDEIKNLNLLGTGEKIPLLEDVLKLINGKVLLDIEFKSDRRAGVLEKSACELLDNYNGSFIVKSFNPFSVLWFKKNRPSYIRGQLACSFEEDKMSKFTKYICKNLLLNWITKPDFIAYEVHDVSDKIAKKAKKSNIPLLLWTINTKKELDIAKNYTSGLIYELIDLK